jgi:hypothetical protein
MNQEFSKQSRNYRMSDSAPLYALLIVFGCAAIIVVVGCAVWSVL